MAHLPHLVAAAICWFVGTGLVLRLVRGPRPGHRVALGWATVVATAAFAGTVWSAGETSDLAAYAGFAGAVAIWGWLELAFLTGALTGPRRAPCPPDATGWRRFRLATATLIHAELALAATLVALAVASWGAPNPVAAATFALLFAMRLAAKLNLFAGVPNPSTELLPPYLAYLGGYFRRRPFGVRMALTLVAALALTAWLGDRAFGGGGTAADTLLFAMATLGFVENAILALPVRDAALWRWALPTAAATATLTIAPTAATSTIGAVQ